MEMAITPSTIVPQVLKKDNYKRWSILMRHYFEAHDLWDVVISKEIPRGVSEREWNKKNAAALLAIKILCEAEIFDKIEEMNSAKDVWDALADMHKPPSVSHEIPQLQEHVPHAYEVEIVEDDKDVSEETEKGKEQYEKLSELIKKGNDEGLEKFLKENPGARSARVFENGSTALHFAITIGREGIARYLIFSTEEISDLEIQDNDNNTPLSLAIRRGRKRVVQWLIRRSTSSYLADKSGKKSNLLRKTDANGRIPVQLACNTGDERMACFLYSKTPIDVLKGDIGFQLLKECITKKMFDIAFDLLDNFQELALPQRCPSDSIPIILTLAQTPPPYFRESQLIFWKRWIYNCTSVKADPKPKPKQIKDEMPFLEDCYYYYYYYYYNYRVALTIIVIACCPWILLHLFCFWICQKCVLKAPLFFKQSLTLARKILEQSLACARKILVQSLACGRKVRPKWQSCDEFRGTLKGVSVGMLKLLLVLWTELPLLPFTIVTMVVLVPISMCALILGRKVSVPVVEKEFECTFIADGLSKLVSLFSWAFARQVYDLKTMDEYARKVIPLVCQPLSKLDQNQFEQSKAVYIEATFHAIKNGIPEIVHEIKMDHANILWSSTGPEGSGNMFAYAIAHRQEKVAQIIYESMDTNLLITTDKDRNNALHIAAKLAPHSRLACISGAALQLQSEVRWFKSVQGIVPRFCNECENNKGQTPTQVFAEEHKNLLIDAEEWMKKTAESSTVVGALIITIMFAVAFTVPGGNEQDTGYPIFLPRKPIPFMVFIVSDAISLFTASSSVLMFLGILTSRYDFEDFLKSLPVKLIIGLSSLFISIATMTTAFCAALFIMLHGRLEVVIPITMLAGIPIAFFGWLQFPLLVEICTSTFSRDIFENDKESFLQMWFELFYMITIELPKFIMRSDLI